MGSLLAGLTTRCDVEHDGLHVKSPGRCLEVVVPWADLLAVRERQGYGVAVYRDLVGQHCSLPLGALAREQRENLEARWMASMMQRAAEQGFHTGTAVPLSSPAEARLTTVVLSALAILVMAGSMWIIFKMRPLIEQLEVMGAEERGALLLVIDHGARRRFTEQLQRAGHVLAELGW